MVRRDSRFTKLTGQMAEAYAGVEGQGEIAFVADEAAGWQVDLVIDDGGIGAYYNDAEGWGTVAWMCRIRNRKVCRVLGEEIGRAIFDTAKSGAPLDDDFLDDILEDHGFERVL